MKIIDGHLIANQILLSAKSSVSSRQSAIAPCLAVLLIGSNPASRLYVSIKAKRAAEIGIKFQKFIFSEDVKENKIINQIKKLNLDPLVSAILVQLPLPKHLNTDKIISAIDPAKDADGIHPRHLQMLADGQIPPVLPATTAAVKAILELEKVHWQNKSIAIIGKSKIVGLPTYYYLSNIFYPERNKSANSDLSLLVKNFTDLDKIKNPSEGSPDIKKLTKLSKLSIRTKDSPNHLNTLNSLAPPINLYDHTTPNLAKKTSQADILIVAIGDPHFITSKYIKRGALIIDVGITKVGSKTWGDVDPKSAEQKNATLTPVPGGVGPITVACLLENTLKLYQQNKAN